MFLLQQGKKTVPNLRDDFCEEQVFPFLFRKGKYGYSAS